MNTVISPKLSRFLPLGLLVIMIAGLIFAPAVQAKRYLSDGTGDSSEGDPLDANDYGSGGGGLIGDDIQNTYGIIESGEGGLVFQLPSSDAVTYVLVDFRGRIPVLRVIKLSIVKSSVEGSDAR